MNLGHTHGWEVVMDYDVRQGKLVALNPLPDLSKLDTSALTLVMTQISVQQLLSPVPSPFKHPLPSKATTQPFCKCHQSFCFDAVPLVIFPPTAKLIALSPVKWLPPLPPEHGVSMPCLHLMADNSALLLDATPLAVIQTPAPISMAVASVATPNIELAAVDQPQDPRHIVTPIDADEAEGLLCKYSIYDDWKSHNCRVTLGF